MGLERPDILPPAIVITIVFMKLKVLECMRVKEDVGICLFRLPTIPLSIVFYIIVVIKVVMMVEI